MLTIANVTIGDKFKHGQYAICEVIDFNEVKSMTSGETVRYECVAKGINTVATNDFIIPFSTVIRHKI